ncbi:catalase family peroxidase [Flaviflagellibacter deserti]|uniref:Catalase-related peroxidase n=1 Tax=Flaviflagellibacter deserti TaxID=2267266 RepID=A0ABV9YYI0_9HYPH
MQDDQPPSDGAPALGKFSILLRLGAIGAVLAAAAGGFAYAGGWFSPGALTQNKIIDTFQAVDGVHEGFRRNHAKGLCASATFASNGAGVPLSKASVFAAGASVPVIARFSIAGGQPYAADSAMSVKSFGLRFLLPGGEEWRTAMIPIPVFPVNTPEAFWEQLDASRPDPATGKPDPAKMQAFAAKHPETAKAIELIKAGPRSAGFSDTTFHGLNAFRFTNAGGQTVAVRWSVVPEQAAPANAALGTDKNALFDALIRQQAQQPVKWRLVVTVGQPGDPTNDATLPWPADRQQVDVGTLTINSLVDEDDGDCTSVNYDPLVLPDGIQPSDDPLLSARSAAYSVSYTRRAGETKPPSAVTASDVRKGEGS